MNIRIVHLGGTEKVCEFDGFDTPRPWARLRYPNGGGVLYTSSKHALVGLVRQLAFVVAGRASMRAQRR